MSLSACLCVLVYLCMSVMYGVAPCVSVCVEVSVLCWPCVRAVPRGNVRKIAAQDY